MLERFGVPAPVLLAVIRSFHVDMRVAVTVREDIRTVLQLEMGFGRGVL